MNIQYQQEAKQTLILWLLNIFCNFRPNHIQTHALSCQTFIMVNDNNMTNSVVNLCIVQCVTLVITLYACVVYYRVIRIGNKRNTKIIFKLVGFTLCTAYIYTEVILNCKWSGCVNIISDYLTPVDRLKMRLLVFFTLKIITKNFTDY